MALKELFKRGISSLLKKKKTDPVSGESQKLITYTPEAKTQTAKQLAKQDAQLPVKVDRKITDDLLMGETRQPAFGSSTYDWVMRKPMGGGYMGGGLTEATQRLKAQGKMGGGMMMRPNPIGMKSGKSVKVKCKLGRNKPTKMY